MSKLEVTIKDLETGEIKKRIETAGIAAATIEEINYKDIVSEGNSGTYGSAECFMYGNLNPIMLMDLEMALDTLKEKIEENPAVGLAKVLVSTISVRKEKDKTEE